MQVLFDISIHALLAESDITMAGAGTTTLPFLSTLSLRRATIPHTIRRPASPHFYPRSPCGERHTSTWRTGRYLYFYPRSPCGERPPGINFIIFDCGISIHALLAESDFTMPDLCQRYVGISIHALLAESDAFLSGSIKFCNVFLSTLSLRRATPYVNGGCKDAHDFYPRSPCGERHRGQKS